MTTTFTDRDFLEFGLKELAGRLAPAGAKPWRLRKLVEDVRRLRTDWAQAFGQRCGLRVVGMLEGRWIRRLNGEHGSLYVAKLAERGVVVPEGTPLLTAEAAYCLPVVGEEVNEELSTKYRTVYEGRRVLRYLTEVLGGNGAEVDPRVLDRERKSLSREWVYFGGWSEERRQRVRRVADQGVLPLGMGATGLRELFKETLAKGGKFEMPSGSTLLVGKVAAALVGARKKPELLKAFGLKFERDHLVGRLARHWETRVAEALLAAGAFGKDAPTLWEAVKVVREVGRAYLASEGLIEDSGLVPDGVGTKAPLVERAKRVAVQRLVLDYVSRTGYDVEGFEPEGLTAVGKVPRGGTVLASMFDRLTPEAAAYWREQEGKGGSSLVTSTLTDVKLLALFDGLASGYLLQFIPSLDGGKQLPGCFADFWDRPDEAPVTPDDFWILRDALLASQVWALAQLVGHGHEWLGLSDGYRRALVLAFRRLFRWLYQPYEVGPAKLLVVGEEKVELPAFADDDAVSNFMRGFLRGGYFALDRLLSQEREVGGLVVPAVLDHGGRSLPLEIYTSRPSYLEGGRFKLDGDRWVVGSEGAVLPGITGEVESRVMGNLVTLLASGPSRHARALLIAAEVRKNGGVLPPLLAPVVPVGMGDVMGYAAAVEAAGGTSLADLVTPLAAVDGDEAAISPAYAGRWTWGSLKSQWATVGAHPGMALGFVPLPLRYTFRALRELPQGRHPISGLPLAEGGGCPSEIADRVKQIWSPFYLGGQVAAGGLDRMAPGVRSVFKPLF